MPSSDAKRTFSESEMSLFHHPSHSLLSTLPLLPSPGTWGDLESGCSDIASLLMALDSLQTTFITLAVWILKQLSDGSRDGYLQMTELESSRAKTQTQGSRTQASGASHHSGLPCPCLHHCPDTSCLLNALRSLEQFLQAPLQLDRHGPRGVQWCLLLQPGFHPKHHQV